jgi:peptidyl-tRNA hydrolase
MYCIFAMDSVERMGGSRGKLGSQAGHAYLHAFWDAEARFPAMAAAYRSGLAFKITMSVPTVDELRALEAAYRDVCGLSLVKDAGRTVFKDEQGNPLPTVTCLGLGPLPESLKGDDLKALRPMT